MELELEVLKMLCCILSSEKNTLYFYHTTDIFKYSPSILLQIYFLFFLLVAL